MTISVWGYSNYSVRRSWVMVMFDPLIQTEHLCSRLDEEERISLVLAQVLPERMDPRIWRRGRRAVFVHSWLKNMSAQTWVTTWAVNVDTDHVPFPLLQWTRRRSALRKKSVGMQAQILCTINFIFSPLSAWLVETSWICSSTSCVDGPGKTIYLKWTSLRSYGKHYPRFEKSVGCVEEKEKNGIGQPLKSEERVDFSCSRELLTILPFFQLITFPSLFSMWTSLSTNGKNILKWTKSQVKK